MQDRLRGIFPPIPTTFDDHGDVDAAAIASNVRQWMTTGLAGILALGSNGEAGLVDEDEGDRVVRAVRQAMPAGKLLLVGTGRESTRGTIAATKRAADLGADAVLDSHAVLLQVADDGGRADEALHRRRRRVAGAGAAVQPAGSDRDYAHAAGDSGAGRPSERHRRERDESRARSARPVRRGPARTIFRDVRLGTGRVSGDRRGRDGRDPGGGQRASQRDGDALRARPGRTACRGARACSGASRRSRSW